MQFRRRRHVELALREPQKPYADFLVRHRSRIRIRLGDGRGEHLGLGFVFLDQGGPMLSYREM
jgi:hypothetical protein